MSNNNSNIAKVSRSVKFAQEVAAMRKVSDDYKRSNQRKTRARVLALAREMKSKVITGSVLVMVLTGIGMAQDIPATTTTAPRPNYWTTQRRIETIGVTALHLADAAQTCYYMQTGNYKVTQGNVTTTHWSTEHGMLTPGNCAGASVVLVGIGPVLQYASYRMTRKYPESRAWRTVDRVLPHVEMGLSVNAIRCSVERSCGQYGF